MANASKNVWASASSSYPYTMSVSWSESNANVANNTSVISASGSFDGQYIGFNAGSSYNYYLRLYWHDNRTNSDTLFASSSVFHSAGYGQGGGKSVSGSITVTHNNDGGLSGYVRLRFESPSTSGGYAPGTTDLSTSWTGLTTIARASSITGVSGSQLGSGVSVTIDRKSTSFTHKVEYDFAGSGYTSVTTSATTSASFTPPVSLASRVPNSTSGVLTVRVTTYNGSTQIGNSVTYAINLSVPSSVVPSLSGLSASRVDNGVPSGWGIYVKGKSQVKISASGASGSYGSTITGYYISGPGISSNSSSATSSVLSSTGTLIYTCTITDSRGRTASKSVSISVVDYYTPSISVSAVRCSSDGTESANGTYLKVTATYSCASVSSKNSISSKSVTCNSVSNTSFSSGVAFILSANVSIGSQYTLTASVTDALGETASASVAIPTAYRIMNVNKNKKGVAFGKFSEKNAFEVNMDTYLYGELYLGAKSIIDKLYPVGAIYLTYNNNNPGNFLGGTWERFGQGRTLVGEGTGNDGSTSMSFSAKNEYGRYNHSHIYGLRYLSNWYDVTTSIALLYNNEKFVGSTSLFTTRDKFNGGHQSSAVELEAGGVDIKTDTSTETSLQPSICVYFWRRIS